MEVQRKGVVNKELEKAFQLGPGKSGTGMDGEMEQKDIPDVPE